MSNTFVNPSMVAKEALRQLENNMVMSRLAYRDYEQEFKNKPNGWKIGDTVSIQAPLYFRVKDGATLDEVDILERDVELQVASRKHVAWAVTAQEMTLDIDKFTERCIKPAMSALANYLDQDVLSGMYKYIPNQVGTPGTTPSDFYTFAQAQAVLSDEACPQDGRYCIVDPWAQAKMADSFKGLFAQDRVRQAINAGSMGGMIAGFDMYMSQNIPTHTCGTAAGLSTVLVDDAGVGEGDETLTIDQNGSLSVVMTAGDIFTVADVYGVNPITGNSTGRLRQFVNTALTTSSGNDYPVVCLPGLDPWKIYSSSASETYLPYQTVNTLPADDAQLTIAGSASLSHKVNIAAHRDCVALAAVPLETPASVSWGATESYNGLSIRVVRDYTISSDTEYIRFDILYGYKVINPFLGCRIAG